MTDDLLAEVTEAGQALAEYLGAPLLLAVAVDPLPGAALTDAERVMLDGWRSARRRRTFCRGRAALRPILEAAPGGTATSISHDDGFSLAAGITGAVRIGIDVEARARYVPRRATRFFVSSREDGQLPDADPTEYLRVWTVKEALFKADPANVGRVLAEYECRDVSQHGGWAAGPGGSLRYASVPFLDGWLSAAVYHEKGDHRE